MDLNSEKLRSFIALVENGSFSKAAQYLNVVPSTISKKVSQLENEIGYKLIVRDKRGVKLTDSGKVFLRHAQEILYSIQECKEELADVSGKASSIRIGSNFSLFQTHIGNWLSSFNRNDTSVLYDIMTDESPRILNKLMNSELDICFSYRSYRENAYNCVPFMNDELVFVTGGDNEKYKNGISISDIKKLPLIKESHLRLADNALYMDIFNYSENIVFNLSYGCMIIPLLQGGRGYGFVLRPLVQQYIDNGSLSEIRILDYRPLHIQSYMIFRNSTLLLEKRMIESALEYAKNHS